MNEHAIITHIHTDASSGEASMLDPVITRAIKSALGHEYESRWKECFNQPQDILEVMKPKGAVSVVFITDHVNEKRYTISREAIVLAAQDPRFAVGVEVQTAVKGPGGALLRAPEILVYGRVEKTRCAGMEFTGVSEEDLEILFEELPLDEGRRIDPISVRDFCLLRGYAHALAHPFDGSQLDLASLLDLITRFKFVETVNGGFPADSSKRLSMFIAWYNKAAAGLIRRENLRSPLLRYLHERATLTGPIHPWGGSDAHAGDHDRVVTLYRTEKEVPTAADVIRDMVKRDVADLIASRTFAIAGTPATKLSLLDDMMKIFLRNILDHRDIIRQSGKLMDIVTRMQEVAREELVGRRRARKLLLREFDETIGEEMRRGLAAVRKNLFPLSSLISSPIDQSTLPERMP